MSRQVNGVGNGGGGGKLTPNIDKSGTNALNLTVLQRIDPFVEEILITAAHVTLYEFNIELNQWSRKDVEGSLFVVKRNSQPRFQFIVMNRRSTENLIEDVLGDFEYEVQVPYLLYRNGSQEVNGIWFYNAHECEAVASLFNRILGAFSKVPPKSTVTASKRGRAREQRRQKAKVAQRSTFLATRGSANAAKRGPNFGNGSHKSGEKRKKGAEDQTCKKSEFEELEAVPSSSVIEGPLEPVPSSSATAPDAPDDSFLNFFTTSMNVGSEPQQPSLPLLTPVIPSAMQAPSLPLSLSSPSPSVLNPPEPIDSAAAISVTSLVKPSYFAPPSSSGLVMLPVAATPTAVTLQRPYGTPLLQPFPPPNPSPSLTPLTSYGPIITKDKVRDALSRLVQNEEFIDMVYREMLNSHAL